MSRYKFYNANPKNKKTGDCVIRAFALATDKSWDDTLTDLFNISLDIKSEPSCKDIYNQYAKELGFIAKKVELINWKKPTVNSFAQDHKKGIFLLKVANHLVTVKDGYYYDTWDCGNKSVYKYWEVPAERS